MPLEGRRSMSRDVRDIGIGFHSGSLRTRTRLIRARMHASARAALALPEFDARDRRDVHISSALWNLHFTGLSLNWSSAAPVIVDGRGASHVEAGTGRRIVHQIDPRASRLASRK